ncbi:hypothetical protein [Streptomyces ossamyceticus]|uniref:Uncharacterized protein n=1 Tax=Streptomyces ossamyceticus TaxID=249581 RepID=A0ABV2V9E3_9ACTN
MSRPQLAHGSLTSLVAALTLLTTGCAENAVGTRADGDTCRAGGGWSAEKQARWLRPAVSFPDGTTAGDAAVVIGSPTGEPLCEPITVQVEFWEADATSAGTDLRPVRRVRLTTDGSRPRTIRFPAGLSPTERDGCTGVLTAAYPGVPLKQTELPTATARLTPASTTADTAFDSSRVAARHLLPPTTACGASGGPTPNPWGGDHP